MHEPAGKCGGHAGCPPHGFNAENYLSDDWFRRVENAAKACRELSLAMWINDGFDYPPGDVAGRVRKAAPHLKQRHIRLEGDRPVVVEADWGLSRLRRTAFHATVHTVCVRRIQKAAGQIFRRHDHGVLFRFG